MAVAVWTRHTSAVDTSEGSRPIYTDFTVIIESSNRTT